MAQIKIPKEKVAIVLIEPQNDFLSEGGTMYAHIKEQLRRASCHRQSSGFTGEGARSGGKNLLLPVPSV